MPDSLCLLVSLHARLGKITTKCLGIATGQVVADSMNRLGEYDGATVSYHELSYVCTDINTSSRTLPVSFTTIQMGK